MPGYIGPLLIVSGLTGLLLGFQSWRKIGTEKPKHIPLLAVFGGLCLGVGIALAGMDINQWRIGPVPWWVFPEIILGWRFYVEVFKNQQDHEKWTPIVGGFAALILALGVGGAVAHYVAQETQSPQFTSIIHHSTKG